MCRRCFNSPASNGSSFIWTVTIVSAQHEKEMARQLEIYSNDEKRWIVCFLWAKHFTNTDTHCEASTVHGPHAISRLAIVKLCQMFQDGRTDLADAEREGRAAKMSTPDTVQRVEDNIRSDCKVKKANVACS